MEIRNSNPKLRSASGNGSGRGSQIDRASSKASIGDIVNSIMDEFDG